MSLQRFQSLIAEFTAPLAGRALDASLASELNRLHGPGSAAYEALFAACRSGVAEGWMCEREAGGIRYGRVIKATPATHGFSVDVVDMNDCIGPHHAHPKGEIDLLYEVGGEARFDRVVVITAPSKLREARRGGRTDDRESRLLPDREKVGRADFAYVNTGTPEELDAWVADVMATLSAERSTPSTSESAGI
jgi:Dephospho-CoA kinase